MIRVIRSPIKIDFLLLGAVAALAPSQGVHGAPIEEPLILKFNGFGDLKTGASIATLRHLGMRPIPNTVDDEQGPLEATECANIRFRYRGVEVGALFRKGRVRRVDITSDGVRTSKGIHVKSNKRDVERAYGNNSEYFVRPPATKIINGELAGNNLPSFFAIRSPDSTSLLLIEIDNDEVVSMHVGDVSYFYLERDGSISQADCLSVLEGRGGWADVKHP